MNNIAVKLDVAKYLGDWQNSYADTQGIGYFKIYEEEGEVKMDITGRAGGMLEGHWGVTTLTPYTATPDGDKASAFHGKYDLGYADIDLTINENKELMIVFSFITFKDGSGRSNCYKREFFYLK